MCVSSCGENLQTESQVQESLSELEAYTPLIRDNLRTRDLGSFIFHKSCRSVSQVLSLGPCCSSGVLSLGPLLPSVLVI